MTRYTDIAIDTPRGPLPLFFGRHFDFPNPTVIVVQEWWGLNGNIQDIALRLTGEEFTAVAPDLYRGKQTTEPDEARKLAMERDQADVAADLGEVVRWLAGQGAERIAVMGFCMGGTQAMELAFTDDRLSAAAVFYGMIDYAGREPKCPIIAHYGTGDRWKAEDLEALRTHLDASGQPCEVHTYEGAGHAFFNDTGDTFDAESADLAWERTIAFFRTHLGA